MATMSFNVEVPDDRVDEILASIEKTYNKSPSEVIAGFVCDVYCGHCMGTAVEEAREKAKAESSKVPIYAKV